MSHVVVVRGKATVNDSRPSKALLSYLDSSVFQNLISDWLVNRILIKQGNSMMVEFTKYESRCPKNYSST